MPASKPAPMEVPNPKRILLVGPPDSGLLELLTELTGSAPTPSPPSPSTSTSAPPSLAGLSHALSIHTPYYKATIPIWLDELPSPPSLWASDFLLPEARDVLSALGAIVLLFRKPATAAEYAGIQELIKAVGRVVKEGLDGGIGGNWEGVALAAAWKRKVVPGVEVEVEEWEEVCLDAGFEFVDGEAGEGGKNQFGEKMGIARLREALEANDWAGDDGLDLDDLGLSDDGDGDGDGGFGAEATELEMEMFGMKRAIYEGGDVGEEFNKTAKGVGGDGEGDEDGVDNLEGLMHRMQGIRDMGADLPEAERKKFAAKAVRDIMKTM